MKVLIPSQLLVAEGRDRYVRAQFESGHAVLKEAMRLLFMFSRVGQRHQNGPRVGGEVPDSSI
jgi:hypothetical protein